MVWDLLDDRGLVLLLCGSPPEVRSFVPAKPYTADLRPANNILVLEPADGPVDLCFHLPFPVRAGGLDTV